MTARKSDATEALHPARLVVSSASSVEEFKKKFQPSLSNTPDLPIVNWSAVGQNPPQVLSNPAQLPSADAVVITWAESEWAAMVHVFCSSGSTMPYSKQNQATWNGWVKDEQGAPSGLGYWGYYQLVQVGTRKVLLYKSNTHYAAAQGAQNLEALTNRLMQRVKPGLILSIGTAGGTRTTDPIGTVNVVRTDVLYESNQPQNVWPEYSSSWIPDWTLPGDSGFSHLLLGVPTTASDLASIAIQFNQFYNTSYPLSELNPGGRNMGAPVPAINNLTGAGTPLVTANSFVVGTTSGNLSSFACVEMDDAIIAKAAAAGKTAFGSVRNISDPIQNAQLPETFQGHWGEAIYTAYGLYTSYNGAIAAWALLA